MEESRVALIGIMVSDTSSVAAVNAALHDFGEHIVGRMGLPLRERKLNAISIVVDAPIDLINALTGKLGVIRGVTAKALFSKSNA